jgi:hypothetical protein
MPRRIVPAVKVFRPKNGLRRSNPSKSGYSALCVIRFLAQRESWDFAVVCELVGNYEAVREGNG